MAIIKKTNKCWQVCMGKGVGGNKLEITMEVPPKTKNGTNI
jgi:hypothetical protein